MLVKVADSEWFTAPQKEAGVTLRPLSADERLKFWARLALFFDDTDFDVHFISALFSSTVIVPGVDSYKYLGEILGGDRGFLFFERSESLEVFEVENGNDLVRFLDLCGRWPFYVSDINLSFVCAFDHEEYLIATGSAEERAMSVAPEAFRDL